MDSWKYSSDKGWIRPKPDKPEAKKINKRSKPSKKELDSR